MIRIPQPLLALIGFIVFVVVLHGIGILRPVEQGITRALVPVQSSLSTWFPALGTKTFRDQQSRIQELEQTVVRLELEQIRTNESLLQCVALQQQDLSNAALGIHGVHATVIGRSPEGDTQVLLLDSGVEKGIAEGQPVVTGDGVLIGTVLQAQPGRSAVALLTNTQSSVGAEVQNGTRSPGIISGQHGLSLRLRFVPQGERIEKGMLVSTSAVNEHIPANLLIGEISDVHFTTGDLFQEASVRSPLDYQRIRYVTIVTP